MKQFLILFSIIMMVFSCKISHTQEEKPTLSELDQRLHDIWALKKVGGVEVTPEQVSAYLEFNLTTNKVFGNTGCNSLSGDLITRGDTIILSNLAVTEKFCFGFDNEQEYLNRLQSPLRYSLNGLELTLLSNESVLTFRKVD